MCVCVFQLYVTEPTKPQSTTGQGKVDSGRQKAHFELVLSKEAFYIEKGAGKGGAGSRGRSLLGEKNKQIII